MIHFFPKKISFGVAAFSLLFAGLLNAQVASVEPAVEGRVLDPGSTTPTPAFVAARTSPAAVFTSSGGESNPVSPGTGNYEIIESALGYSFTSGAPDFSFGDVITTPLRTADSPTVITQALLDAGDYWRPAPVRPGEAIQTAEGLTTPVLPTYKERYYYSPHADFVFASQPGQARVTWVTASPDEAGNFQTLTEFYTVSVSTEQTERYVYWTEVDYNAPRVAIPTGIIQNFKLIYNDRMPAEVTPEERVQPNGTFTGEIPVGTVWYDVRDNLVRAYNREGSVLVEYLGNPRGEGGRDLREHLGLEVIRVRKQLQPLTVETLVGNQILPSKVDGEVLSDREYFPIQTSQFQAVGSPTKEHFLENRRLYYGVLENNQAPNVEFYWLKEDERTVRWPLYRNNYLIKWPEEISDYSAVFVRPPLNSETAEIERSFIDLVAENSPELVSQDDPAGGEASLDFQFRLYVDLDAAGSGRNRSLIRMNSGNDFWYVRIYSATTDFLSDSNVDAGGTDFDPENELDFYLERNVVVGQRIDRPHPSLKMGGFIDASVPGNAYDSGSYIDPFTEGVESAADGSIIPVNALAGNNQLRVWWFKQLDPPPAKTNNFKSLLVPAVIGDYTISYPENPREIILASNEGSGELSSEKSSGGIYVQNDQDKPGYNPNEEHAIMIAGRAYALRDDLNGNLTSEPFLLLSHPNATDGRPDMSVFKVLREKNEIVFNYEAIAGKLLQAPSPLPLLPGEPILANGLTANREITLAGTDDVPAGGATENLAHYNRFTFTDRKGKTWVYRGPHAPDEIDVEDEPKLAFQYFYKTLPGFAFPNSSGVDVPPAIGTIVPYLSPLKSSDPIGDGTPLTVIYTPRWPAITPLLHFGETLGNTKVGLPQVFGATSAQLVYQQSIAEDTDAAKTSVVLHDSTINRVSNFGDLPTLDSIPGTVKTSFSRGKTYFQNLPSHLEARLYVDLLVGTDGALVFTGEYRDEPVGEDFVFPNTLTPAELDLIKGLCDEADPDKAGWDSLIDGLILEPVFSKRLADGTVETLNLDEYLTDKSFGEIIGQEISASVGPTTLPEAVDPDQVIASYLISAVGGGSGYVTLVMGNGKVNSEPGDPVQMQVFRVGEKLYRGELKPLVAGNPLSENVTVQHTGDFAARTDQFEFQWLKAAPVNGLAPPVFLYENETLSGVLAEIKSSRPIFDETNGEILSWEDGEGVSALPIQAALNPSGTEPDQPNFRITASLNLSGELGAGSSLEDVYISLRLGSRDGMIFLLNGAEELRYGALDGADSERAANQPSELAAFLNGIDDAVVFKMPARSFRTDAANEIEVQYNSTDPVDTLSTLDIRIAITTKQDKSDLTYLHVETAPGKNRHTISGSGIDTLGDNYYIMRYRPLSGHALNPDGTTVFWSEWTRPALVEGWIKRVLAGINPFNQRVSDFFDNAVNTNTSLISQAGTRWEGDIALNLDAVQSTGLIEIYETVLKRGINLSINGTPEVDYAPANDALLLAAGYLSDLYLALGNEAFADAANPTVSFDSQALGLLGAATQTTGFEENFRSTSTSRFAFQGQVATLLDEELSLLRGRDDFLAPSIEIAPSYNRLFWNYTRGIDAGELIYALNYNIRELNDGVADGRVDAEDAQRMFPQAHGDAYGHYLTAVKNYYRLLVDEQFTWGTRIEAVNVLGQPVSVDYFDERKFASGIAALARTADQILSLERRKAFESGEVIGWSHLSDAKENPRTNRTRHWGVDDWAARGGQGAFFNWVVGNAIVPEKDTVNEGIQKIDRSTVPELNAVAKLAAQMQQQMDNANRRVNPLNLSDDSLLLDISPTELAEGKTHFEQIYERATRALSNADAIFERAADSTRLLRSLENQSQNLTQVVDDEETAFNAELIAVYGTPYPNDIGAGKVYPQGYNGPDLLRYLAIDRPFEILGKSQLFSYPGGTRTFTLGVKNSEYIDSFKTRIEDLDLTDGTNSSGSPITIQVELTEDNGPYLLAKPEWGKRASPGSLQALLGEVRLAEEQLYAGLNSMSIAQATFERQLTKMETDLEARRTKLIAQGVFDTAEFLFKTVKNGILAVKKSIGTTVKTKADIAQAAVRSVPEVVGTSNDVGFGARAAILTADLISTAPITALDLANSYFDSVSNIIFITAEEALKNVNIGIDEATFVRDQIESLRSIYSATYSATREVDALVVAHHRAVEAYRTELANGDTLLTNREVFRRRAAAAVQGYRTRDVAFRTFRSEALEEYQTLLDWASQYAFLAAQAYDYETGLLGSKNGQAFLGKIVSARALGTLDDSDQPMIAASAHGDSGLSGLLAKLKGDYDVVKGRLGFNNPETNGTTFSLRREYFRIPDGPEGDIAWQQKLEALVTTNLLTDADIAAHAMRPGGAEASSQPGFLISFPSTIEAGKNFFGKDLMPGDSDFSTSSFATKVNSLGVVFEGYQGMSPCLICAGGGGNPSHNHDDALSATPDVFLIPTGLDTLRTPPLGDGQALRTWSVQDYAMPLPFDLGSVEPTSDSVQQTSDKMLANFRTPRRHPSFRATDREEFFFTDFSKDYTSSRLVGRSVWNSNWKLAIPARELLANEQEGISRFIRTVKDIKFHLKTYSYSGN